MARQCPATIGSLCLPSAVVALLIICLSLPLTACDLLPGPPPPTSADYCNILPVKSSASANNIVVWASAPRQHCLRLYAPYLAAELLPQSSVTAVEKNINSGPYFQLIQQAASNTEAPDIAFIYNGGKLDQLASDGYLFPLSQCGIPPDTWSADMYVNGEWGLPFEVDVNLLFYSKHLLRKLGWSEAQINEFPARTATGQITLQDLTDIATQALNRGIANKGYVFLGFEQMFYPIMSVYNALGGEYRLQELPINVDTKILTSTFEHFEFLHDKQLLHPAFAKKNYANLSNRLTIRDALAHGRILFANTRASEWKRMLLDHIHDPQVLQNSIGMALLPPVKRNKPGTLMIRSVGSYVIFSKKATGRDNQLSSCRLLKQLTQTNLHQQHANNTTQTTPTPGSLLPSTYLPAFNNYQITMAVSTLPEYYKFYFSTLNALEDVITGRLTPAEAARAATSRYSTVD